MSAQEINFGGPVRRTHSYAGLARGNLESQKNVRGLTRPKAAAMQGLAKRMSPHEIGLRQAWRPPRERPAVHVLRQLDFGGREEQVLRRSIYPVHMESSSP